MDTSARSLKGKVLSVRVGSVMTEIEVAIEPATAAAAIPTSAFERLKIGEGDTVTLSVNPTSVVVGK
ncbi:MAG TPA: TOBE domain-containing protein [Candidatus Sulfotelmatobacter sp.]|nr:TOBE domain-containing protein [Candidatus Sulfotelmatobacter sp.]